MKSPRYGIAPDKSGFTVPVRFTGRYIVAGRVHRPAAPASGQEPVSLSYGERARLVLARLVATGCNFLMLDEPINHLDIPSRAKFEQAMLAFEGTVLAVVHDRYFIRRFATCIWAIHDGTRRRYIDLEDLQRVRGDRLRHG